MSTLGLARAMMAGPGVRNVKQLHRHEPSFWLRCRLAGIDQAALNSRLTPCPHWRPGVPAVVALWRDSALWCLPCAAAGGLAVDAEENDTCDRCRCRCRTERMELCTIAGRYAVVVFGLCPGCTEREVDR